MEMRLATIKEFDVFNQIYISFWGDSEKDVLAPVSARDFKNLVDLESLYFAVLDEKVVGFAVVYAYEDLQAKIELFSIKEKRKGYGTKFYSLIEKLLKENNMQEVYLHAYFDEAQIFWRKMGFDSPNGSVRLQKKI